MSGGEALWTFACRFYGEDAVREACLALQDAHGRDVGLLLLACWLADEGLRIEPDGAARLEARTRAIRRDALGPVRTARRALPAHGDILSPPAAAAIAPARKAMLEAELAVERVILLELGERAAAETRTHARTAELARHNLRVLAGAAPLSPAGLMLLDGLAARALSAGDTPSD